VSCSVALEPAKIFSIRKKVAPGRIFQQGWFMNYLMKIPEKSNVASKLRTEIENKFCPYGSCPVIVISTLPFGATGKSEWAQCAVSIDEANHRLHNKPKKLIMDK